jgi:hypothetical protein
MLFHWRIEIKKAFGIILKKRAHKRMECLNTISDSGRKANNKTNNFAVSVRTVTEMCVENLNGGNRFHW